MVHLQNHELMMALVVPIRLVWDLGRRQPFSNAGSRMAVRVVAMEAAEGENIAEMTEVFILRIQVSFIRGLELDYSDTSYL
jgi:hypothetical protein